MPESPGVYLYKNAHNKIIYVGKAKNLKKRVSSYFSKNALDAKTLKLVGDIVTIDHIQVGSEVEAFLLESVLIKKYKPFYNIQLQDDKFFPYIKISKGTIPYLVITRKKEADSAYYFGPYTSANDLKIILKALRRIFPFQSVKNHPKRKCLYYHLGLCPCIPVVPENLNEYKKNLSRIRQFLNGKKQTLQKELKKEQQQCIHAEEFEKAALIQQKIESIERLTSEHYSPFQYAEKPDFYFERLKTEVDSLITILSKHDPRVTKLERIECYDISNIQGKQATGSMVVLVNGDVSKKDYRRFKIKSKTTPDDFFMMNEMVTRRLKNDWPLPDLFVIDGGKGQVSAAMGALRNANIDIPLIGLAKREEIIVLPIPMYGNKYDFEEIKLPKETPGINMLRRIRDEAHRFALTYHRLLRKKNMLEILKK
ncbi:MAG TPA: excinuclease ABC subunit UvrC [Candidatus Levybacteria bacterium]|nr:excinuclease ABC subunit UvrC [Candidatus Levybacteria bacterium]